ncbi:hypothetical protein FQA45_01630 [Glutamicibacter halophytocola]|uniref:DUF6998 domain-containing protein n=1 Tax=Glutamicibacter halophytocola TaxID=1933880 RepID=A0ABX5Y841_9MICC|nr:hypothetical protein [Glutamicibacter halophytocola]QDY65111.1 hypothetical protein FQA45_01630 [Glutamicibacter halophytocola]
MTPEELQQLPTGQLLRLETMVRAEFTRRGISRTAGSLAGELGEHLTKLVYGGTLAVQGTASHDLIDRQDRTIQVKTRMLPTGAQRHFQFNEDQLEFELAVCLRFNRETFELERAREFNRAEIEDLSTEHETGPRLRTGKAFKNGKDKTELFRTALASIDI